MNVDMFVHETIPTATHRHAHRTYVLKATFV